MVGNFRHRLARSICYWLFMNTNRISSYRIVCPSCFCGLPRCHCFKASCQEAPVLTKTTAAEKIQKLSSSTVQPPKSPNERRCWQLCNQFVSTSNFRHKKGLQKGRASAASVWALFSTCKACSILQFEQLIRRALRTAHPPSGLAARSTTCVLRSKYTTMNG